MPRKFKDYRKIWEDYHGRKIPKGMHIHHIDGNCENNDPKNLLLCTPEEHWQIHFEQGDSVALRGKFIQHAAKPGPSNGMYGLRGELNPNKNKVRSSETKVKISEALRGDKNPNYKHGLKSTQKQFYCKCGNRLSVGYSKVCNNCKSAGGSNPKAKKVICTATNRIWDCIKDAAIELNIKQSTLRAWLNPNNPNPNKTTLRYL